MSIAVVCPGCSNRLNTPDSYAGKTVRCQKCKASVTVPLPGESQAPVKRDVPADDVPEQPRKRRTSDTAREERPSGSSPALLIGVVLGVLVLGVFVVYFLSSRESARAERRAEAMMATSRPEVRTGEDQWQPPAMGRPRLGLPPPTGELAPRQLSRLSHVSAMAFSPDSRQFATVQTITDAGKTVRTLQVWDLHTSLQAAQLHQGNDAPATLVFSPDGRRLAGTLPSNRGYDIAVVWAVDGGEPARVPLPKATKIGTRLLGFSADGASLIAVVDNAIHRVDLVEQTTSFLTRIERREQTPIAYSPTLPVVVTGGKQLTTANLNDGTTRSLPLEGDDPVGGLTFSGDGKTLGVLRRDEIELRDTETWAIRDSVEGAWVVGDWTLYQPELSANAATVVSLAMVKEPRPGMNNQTVNVWSGPDLTWRELDLEDVTNIVLSPDGKTLALTASDRGFHIIKSLTENLKTFDP